MGGDGGVVATNRRYLRGAGAGDKTGDANDSSTATTIDPGVIKEERARAMKFCAISNQPLKSGGAIVVCPYGKLYIKEAVVEGLLNRKKAEDPRLDHIRGLKDLHEVRFQKGGANGSRSDGDEDSNPFPVCPVRGTELNGQIPAVVLVPGTPGVVNVVSERALKEMGEEIILGEYGPAEKRIKLLPLGDELEAIKEQCVASKKSKKKDKKRKLEADPAAAVQNQGNDGGKSSQGETSSKSKVFKSIFTQPSEISEKDRADNLFVRGG